MTPKTLLPTSKLITLSLTALLAAPALAELSLISPPGADDFILCDGSNAAPIYAEPAETPAVTRAIGDLAEDVARVSGVRPALASATGGAKSLVIVGTLGASKTLEQLAADGKLDVSGVRGQWESYVLQIVKNPLPGVASALVIAGSDRRGTIYGIYHLSETIGVSPWHWWADVPARTNPLVALHGGRFQQGPPAVKYRGIFLNDEDWGLRPWAGKTFDTNTANIGPKTYAKVFELLLRLRANLLWPAMRDGTAAFNSYPANKELADAYGIVMGSSPCEPMLRNHASEWDTNKLGEYNYASNRDAVLGYWEERVRENGKFENLYTLGMCGLDDSGKPPEPASRLRQVIADQRELLRRHVNTNVAAVPQIMVPFQEAKDAHRLAPDLPDDITLVWPDNNYGYVRPFSSEGQRRRAGGAGVFYHLSYLGRPANYLWLCSTPPALIAEEMTKAYHYGANQLWIADVGDLKPAEIATEFFLRLAWNPHAWNGTNTDTLLERQFARDFGATNAHEIASLMGEYHRLNFLRKPEHMRADTNSALLARQPFSLTLNGDEAGRRLKEWQTLIKRLNVMENSLPAALEDAFFAMVAYSVGAAAIVNEQAFAFARYQDCLAQDRPVAKDFVQWTCLSDDLLEGGTAAYNRSASNKWAHFMSLYPAGRTFALPTNPPPVAASNAVLGLLVEGSETFVRADQPGSRAAALPQFNRLTRRAYFVDVFNGGGKKLHWTASADADWIHLGQTNGSGDARVSVTINWSNAPAGDDLRGSIRVAAGTNQAFTIGVSAFNPAETSAAQGADFVEDNRVIVMEAEHASAIQPGKDAQWRAISGLGYNGMAMSVFPVTTAVRSQPETITNESPCLQYRVWLRHPGLWTVTLRALPTFSVEAGKPQRYAVAVDDALPQVVSLPAPTWEEEKQGQENMLRNAALPSSTHQITKPGLHTLKVWMVDPGLVLDSIFAATAGAPPLGYAGPAETRPVATRP